MTTRSTRGPRRRTVVALAVVLAVLSAFVVRLVDIQIVNADEHVADSLRMGIGVSTELYGARGSIVDETGATLAGSIVQYDAQLDPSNVGAITRKDDDGTAVEVPWKEVSAQIGDITGQSAKKVRSIVKAALDENPDSQYAELAKGLSTEQYRDLSDLGIPFLYFTPHPARTYPDGAVAGNLVGFIGTDGDPLAGLEELEDSCLSPTNGVETYSRGKDGVIIPGTLQQTAPEDGGTLQLTINRDLQWYLQQLIAEEVGNQGAQSGGIMVVEVATGKIRAAAEYPTVDPNDFGATDARYRESRLFLDSFEPGSTFKAITAATVMDAAGLTPESTVTASSTEDFSNGARINDSFVHGPLNFTLAGALIDSSNVAVSKFGEAVSPQTRHDYLQRFGVGHGTAVDWPGEAQGELYPVSEWDNQSMYTTTFGQHFTVTAPQVASAYQALANDGVREPLSLVESCTRADGTVVEPDLPDAVRVVSKKTAHDTTAVLENVLAQGALASAVAVPGYRVAGKTGTAQKPDGQGGYKDGLYFTTLVGYAPADDPQYVVIVTLDEPTKVKSSAANASGFQKAMTQVLKTYRVMPSTTQMPFLQKYL